MNLLLRILPVLIILGVVYPFAKSILALDPVTRFSGAFFVAVGLFYIFVEYNIWMMKRTNQISIRSDLAPKNYAHIFNIIGSAVLTYGFFEHNNLLMLAGGVLYIYAYDLLTRVKKKKYTKQKNNIKRYPTDAKESALLNALKEKKKEDPFIMLKVGGQEITQRVMESLKSKDGVHVESVLGILGSLAGYACHAAYREEFVDSGRYQENQVFTSVTGKEGEQYYFSDNTNKLLAEDKVSVWGIVAGNSVHLSQVPLPDIKTLFLQVTKSVGSKDFGIPQVPEEHKPTEQPLTYVKKLWHPLLPAVEKFCEGPMERPILFAFAIQHAINLSKDVIPPAEAAKLVMECAVPMSKIGPEWLT